MITHHRLAQVDERRESNANSAAAQRSAEVRRFMRQSLSEQATPAFIDPLAMRRNLSEQVAQPLFGLRQKVAAFAQPYLREARVRMSATQARMSPTSTTPSQPIRCQAAPEQKVPKAPPIKPIVM